MAGRNDILVTVHPSSILRAPDDAARREAYRAFVDDLRTAARPAERAARANARASRQAPR